MSIDKNVPPGTQEEIIREENGKKTGSVIEWIFEQLAITTNGYISASFLVKDGKIVKTNNSVNDIDERTGWEDFKNIIDELENDVMCCLNSEKDELIANNMEKHGYFRGKRQGFEKALIMLKNIKGELNE